MENKLPPIPTPASQRWREFRIQVLPFLMFIAIVFAIVLLWRGYVQPIGVIGFAETNQVSVTSLGDGVIENLYAESFQVVTQGQVIAIVSGTASDVIRAQIASAQAELEVMRDRLKLDIARITQNIFDARENLYRHELTQTGAIEDWQQRSNDFRRAKVQFETDKTMPEAEFERIKSLFAVITAQIGERGKAIKDLHTALEAMRQQNSQNQSMSVDVAIKAKATELELMLKPSYLKAPIDGMVSVVHRRQGERILRGDSVATIVDPQARRVIGYIRQPLNLLPSTNDIVKIIKRAAPAAIAEGRIQRVGAQFEFINPALLADSKRLEVGLPILVNVPAGFPLVPGEYVTLTIDYVR